MSSILISCVKKMYHFGKYFQFFEWFKINAVCAAMYILCTDPFVFTPKIVYL